MEYKSEQLVKAMHESVYPKLHELMRHNDIKSFDFEFSGSKKVRFFNNGTVQWLNDDGVVSVERNIISNPNDRPYKDNFPVYLQYCNLLMDKITELEKNLHSIDKIITRANSIHITYERKVIIEKIEKQLV